MSFNLHPPLTAFPLALITVLVLLEAFNLIVRSERLNFTAGVLMCLAVVSVTAAFFSGYPASEAANRTFTIDDRYISEHHNYGRLLLFAIVPCGALKVISDRAVFNRVIFKNLYLFLLIVCFGLVAYTGYLGGELVFTHGAGVGAQPQQPGEEETPA